MSGFLISVGHQGESATFQLHPKTRVLMRERFPKAHPVVSVYLSYQDYQDLGKLPSATLEHVAQLLTSLSTAEIRQLGGFEVVEPRTGRLIYRSQQAEAA